MFREKEEGKGGSMVEVISLYVGGSANELLQLISFLAPVDARLSFLHRGRSLSWQAPNRHLGRYWLFRLGLGLSSCYRSPKIKLHDIKHQPLVRLARVDGHVEKRHAVRLCVCVGGITASAIAK